jgi:hypothetical protein
VAGLVWAGALLLAAAGLAKIFRPDPTGRAIRAVAMPRAAFLGSTAMVRMLGLIEVLVGTAVLGVSGPIPAALLAVSYLVLTVVAAVMIGQAPTADCGCFGASAEPVSRWHIAVNAAYTLIAASAVAWPQNGVVGALESVGAAVIAVFGLAVLLAWLSYQLMTSLPALLVLRAKVATPR